MVRALAVAACCASLALAARAETLDELLASRALENVVHPIAAEFVAVEGAPGLSEAQRATAVTQLKRALGRQTNPMTLTMRGASGMMNTPSMQRMMESAQRQSSVGGLAGGLVRGALGINSAQPELDPAQSQREMEQAMAEPWVRGVGAARALAGLGDAEAAARFYVACLQVLQGDWAPTSCLEDILGLGPRRAEVLLTWMLDNAAALSASPMGFSIGALAGDDEDGAGGAPTGGAQLTSAALEGLGALIGGGRMAEDARERAFATLLRHAAAKDNEAYLLGVAEGLARSKDPRAVEALEKLAGRRGSADVRQAAQRGLAVAFRDEDAISALRRELKGKDEELELRAAQVLYELADEEAFEWAVDVITQRRTADAGGPDVRGQVVRDLVELGGEPSRVALRAALDDGSRNEWVEAWIAVGLLELGDETVVPQVEVALTVDDWDLDPRGIRSIWRAIKPFLQYATQLAMTGGLSAVSSSDQLREVTSLIGNAVQGERSRHLSKLDQRASLTAQLRWQAADAIAEARPDGAVRMLQTLLADPTPGVQSSAALALARLSDDAEVLPLIASVYDTALAAAPADASAGHGPELRATLVRSAVLNSPTSDATRALLAKAAADPDAGVRFIALAASAAN
jgi:HEAT repeat protein